MIKTTLDMNYQPGWNINHALRELMANGKDGEESRHDGLGKLKVEFHPKQEHQGFVGCVNIYNFGIKVPAEAMAMGHSGSRSDANLIGEFGEGLPMAMLTIARSSRYHMVIRNMDEQWIPEIRHHGDLDCHTLHIRTRKLKNPREGFLVKVYGVSQEEYDALRNRFLFTNEAFDPEKVKTVGYEGERILLQPEFKGMIFNKGVLVMQRPDNLSYGYDLRRATNRDRELVDEWDLKWALGKLTVAAFRDEPDEFGDHVEAVLDNPNAMEAQQAYAFVNDSTVVKHIGDRFLGKHGEGAVPVENLSQAKELAHVGKKGVVVGRSRLEVLEQDTRIKGFHLAKRDGRMTVTQTYSWDDLTDQEQENIDDACRLIQATDATDTFEYDVLSHVNVVEFEGDDVRGTFKSGEKVICLSRKTVGNLADTIEVMFHEVAHLAGDDGDVAHERRQLDLATQAMIHLLQQRKK